MSERATSGILPIQRAVATAFPTAWRDAIVASVHDDVVTIVSMSGETIDVVTSASLTVGEPVSFHAVAEVLALGAEWHPARSV